jgi:hypothetical protein
MYISLDHGHLSPQDYTSQYTLYHTSSPAPNCLQVPNPRTMSRWVTQEYPIHKQEIRRTWPLQSVGYTSPLTYGLQIDIRLLMVLLQIGWIAKVTVRLRFLP